ncbi:uncharacterized protein EV154DRAFT_490104 [Mucor mucedo]|uniref:uncharacterized protein n=1 Tax=Mucor mucedo TaxID=29922 RepID=UPI00221E78E4|nr:uncharacterized protein EV154DRAFT_490104 [Mucor mucedo]KAI7896991.1 hypothetical protein EV154DRAFT_490104 [Mucor mucedo]
MSAKLECLKACHASAEKLLQSEKGDEKGADQLYNQLDEERKKLTQSLYFNIEDTINIIDEDKELMGEQMSDLEKQKLGLEIEMINLATFFYNLYHNKEHETSFYNFFQNVVPSSHKAQERDVKDDTLIYVKARILWLIQELKKGNNLETAVDKCLPFDLDKYFFKPGENDNDLFAALSDERNSLLKQSKEEIMASEPIYLVDFQKEVFDFTRRRFVALLLRKKKVFSKRSAEDDSGQPVKRSKVTDNTNANSEPEHTTVTTENTTETEINATAPSHPASEDSDSDSENEFADALDGSTPSEKEASVEGTNDSQSTPMDEDTDPNDEVAQEEEDSQVQNSDEDHVHEKSVVSEAENVADEEEASPTNEEEESPTNEEEESPTNEEDADIDEIHSSADEENAPDEDSDVYEGGDSPGESSAAERNTAAGGDQKNVKEKNIQSRYIAVKTSPIPEAAPKRKEEFTPPPEGYRMVKLFKRKVAVPWEQKEVDALEAGLSSIRHPSWAAIKSAYPEELARRDPVAIKDKARNELRKLERQGKTTAEELGPYQYIKPKL